MDIKTFFKDKEDWGDNCIDEGGDVQTVFACGHCLNEMRGQRILINQPLRLVRRSQGL